MATTLGQMPPTAGNAVELIHDYDAVFDRLIADVDAARQSVHLLVYIFADDSVGHQVVASLARAAARGVSVRVMFDAVESRRSRRAIARRLRGAGVEVREALPFRLFRRHTRRDMRNHRKLFVIDGRIGYAGSQNFVDKSHCADIVNRELVARVLGPAVASMDALVRAD